MNTIVPMSVLLALSFAAAPRPAGLAEPSSQVAEDAVVSVRVTGLESDEGSVQVALFDGPEGFTEEPAYAGVVVPEDLSAEWSVHVPFGTYAVAVIHDRDDNGRLNTNFLGMPREPYGFSNDARGTFGAPSFEDASFSVAADTVVVTVRAH
jgi:uncharacterized protein (DUF2141 family)